MSKKKKYLEGKLNTFLYALAFIILCIVFRISGQAENFTAGSPMQHFRIQSSEAYDKAIV